MPRDRIQQFRPFGVIDERERRRRTIGIAEVLCIGICEPGVKTPHTFVQIERVASLPALQKEAVRRIEQRHGDEPGGQRI